MDSSQTRTELSSRLAAAGFDFTHPDPLAAWRVFKAFASEPVECADDALLWQCGVFRFAPEGPRFHWDMTRQFSFEVDGEYDHMEQLSLTLFFPVRPELASLKTHAWTYDFDGLDAFFRYVENLEEFKVPADRFSAIAAELRHEQV